MLRLFSLSFLFICNALFADGRLHPVCETFTYDSLGRVVQSQIDGPPFLDGKLVYSYNGAEMKPAKISTLDSSGKLVVRELLFTYDSAGRLLMRRTIVYSEYQHDIPPRVHLVPVAGDWYTLVVKEKPDTFEYRCWWTPSGKLARDSGSFSKAFPEEHIFHYSESDSLLGIMTYGLPFEDLRREMSTLFFRDEKGRVIREEDRDSTQQLMQVRELRYDAKGRLTATSFFLCDAGKPKLFNERVYRYDRSGRLKSVKVIYPGIPKWKCPKLETYRYNKKGRLMQSCRLEWV